jgi:hypothetical protein
VRRLRLVALALVVAACTITDDLKLVTNGPSGPSTNCVHAFVPPKPTGPDKSGSDFPTFYGALKSIDTGVIAKMVGRDLDGLCTCPIDPAPCKMRANSDPCDATDAGLENAVGTVFDKVKSLVPASEQINAGLKRGESLGMVIRVEGYSGEADDPAVTVGVYQSTGLETFPPTWTEADKWKLDTSATAGDAPRPGNPERRIPRVSATSAYVKNGILVAPLEGSDGTTTFRLTPVFEVKLYRAFLTARIVRGDAGTAQLVDGLLTGVWNKDDLFRGIRNLAAPGQSSKSLCEVPLVVGQASQLICQHLDLPLNELNTRDTYCDAASFGMQIEFSPASLGRNEAPTVVPSKCMEQPLNCE